MYCTKEKKPHHAATVNVLLCINYDLMHPVVVSVAKCLTLAL